MKAQFHGTVLNSYALRALEVYICICCILYQLQSVAQSSALTWWVWLSCCLCRLWFLSVLGRKGSHQPVQRGVVEQILHHSVQRLTHLKQTGEKYSLLQL